MKTIWDAVESQDINSVKKLLEEGLNPDIREESEKAPTPLLKAAASGSFEIVKLLLEAGADISAVDINKTTALHFSSWFGHLEVTRYLLEKGCSTQLTEGDGWTALHDAVRKENLPMAAEILTFPASDEEDSAEGMVNKLKGLKGDPLLLAILKEMKKRSIRLDSVGICGKSLLDDAVERGYKKSAAYIREHKS